MSSICVYCSSSNAIADAYPPVAEALGQEMGRRGHELVYGGGAVGLMGVLAEAAHEAGGTVTGVIPSKLQSREGIAYDADELIVTDTMRERKRIMYQNADAFAVLPGGYGTLEEFMEVLTLKQLGYHDRPIAILNADGFYDTLFSFFEELRDGRFARAAATDLVEVVSSAEAALDRIERVAASDGQVT
ncbi:TIGR00730 family Rossman fold protein [Salinibacter grassmerensis]|uniref:LOG family protein n=1 Tax=Salinibacter grassmerensis TaxID=3040353 RepID=UPI0021E9957D|nr:TIGR00730 family Rossman fold protein [Salinibacter grassmerensis]